MSTKKKTSPERRPEADRDVQQARHALEETLPDLVRDAHKRIIVGELKRWSPESILLLNALVRCWITDGVIRLLGVADDPALTGQEIQRQVEAIFRHGNLLDTLAKLLVQTRDPVSVVGILTLFLHHWMIHEEIIARLGKLRQGPEWVALMREPDLELAEKKMAQLANQPWVYGKQLEAWYRLLPKDDTAEGRQERVDVAMEAMAALYDTVRQGVTPLMLSYMPGPFVGRGKPVPRWEAVAPEIQRATIADLQRTFLPAFEMEKGRLLILDAFKARKEAASAKKRTAEEADVEKIITKEPPGHTEAVMTDGIHVSEILNYAQQHLTAKMFHAFELLASDEHMTDVDAAKQADVTPQGIRQARKRLREVFRKDPSAA